MSENAHSGEHCGENILDHPDLQALGDLERQEAALALRDPAARERLMLRTSLALLAEVKAARTKCTKVCAPNFERRVRNLERWRTLVCGAALGVGFALGTLREWIGWGKG